LRQSEQAQNAAAVVTAVAVADVAVPAATAAAPVDELLATTKQRYPVFQPRLPQLCQLLISTVVMIAAADRGGSVKALFCSSSDSTRWNSIFVVDFSILVAAAAAGPTCTEYD
jgi:hypothetical protein